jgi:hypothetical protein
MRYSYGGGLTAEGWARRERVRLQAAQMLEQDLDLARVAGLLRVSAKSVYQWRLKTGGHVLPAARPPGRKGERRSIPKADYAGLIAAAYRTLAAPVIVITLEPEPP